MPAHAQFPAKQAVDRNPSTRWNSLALFAKIHLTFEDGPEIIDAIKIWAFTSWSGTQWYTIYGLSAVTGRWELICTPTQRNVSAGTRVEIPPLTLIGHRSYKELEIYINS